MKRYAARLLLVLVGILLFATSPVYAATEPSKPTQPGNRGLSISPIRKYITVAAGATKKSSFTVGNYTDKPMTVSLSINQFSVADYTYDFEFNETVGTKLLSLSAPATLLQPGESRTIPYQIEVPKASTPGGRYYTILATAASNDNANKQIQAASLVYITVDGKLTYTNNIGAAHMQRLVFGSRVPFSIDVSNTGNIHYFMYLSAGLHGPLTSTSHVSESHLLLPIKTRHIEGSFASPVLPGVYRASYGYRTEHTPAVVRSAWVVFIPPWSIAAVLLAAWLGWRIYHQRRKQALQTHTSPPPPASPTD